MATNWSLVASFVGTTAALTVSGIESGDLLVDSWGLARVTTGISSASVSDTGSGTGWTAHPTGLVTIGGGKDACLTWNKACTSADTGMTSVTVSTTGGSGTVTRYHQVDQYRLSSGTLVGYDLNGEIDSGTTGVSGTASIAFGAGQSSPDELWLTTLYTPASSGGLAGNNSISTNSGATDTNLVSNGGADDDNLVTQYISGVQPSGSSSENFAYNAWTNSIGYICFGWSFYYTSPPPATGGTFFPSAIPGTFVPGLAMPGSAFLGSGSSGSVTANATVATVSVAGSAASVNASGGSGGSVTADAIVATVSATANNAAVTGQSTSDILFVQDASASSGGASVATAILDPPTTIGNFLTAAVGLPAGVAVQSITDTTHNRWIQVGYSYTVNSGAELWMARAIQGGDASVTVVTGLSAVTTLDNDVVIYTTPDASASPHTGTLVGPVYPTLVSSPWSGFTSAFSFSQSFQAGDGVNCGTGVPVRSGASVQFTLEAKVQTTDTHLDAICGWSSGNNILFQLTTSNTGSLLFQYQTLGGLSQFLDTGPTISDGNPHSVAVDYDAHHLRTYVDGVVAASVAFTGASVPTGANFWIGSDDQGDDSLDGIVDEVRWSNEARYAGPYTPATSPFTGDSHTLGLWHLDAINTLPFSVNVTEWENVWAVDPLDQWSQNFGTNALVAPQTISPRTTGDLVISVGSSAASIGAPSAGYTGLSMGNQTQYAAAYDILSSSTAPAMHWTTTASSVNTWACVEACFVPGAPGVNAMLQFPETLVEISPNVSYQDPLGGMGVWINISHYVRSMQLGPIGRQHELDRVQAATANIVCNNRIDGAFNPWNTESFLYSDGNGLNPMCPVRVTAAWSGVTYSVYYGYIQSMTPAITDVLNIDMNIACVDIFQALSLAYLSSNVYAKLVEVDGGSDLQAYYRLGDQPGAYTVQDYSGNGNTGSLVAGIGGTPAYGAQGPFLYDPNTALDLTNGTNLPNGGFATIDNTTEPPAEYNFLSSASVWTFECWVQWTDTSGTPNANTPTPNGVLLRFRRWRRPSNI